MYKHIHTHQGAKKKTLFFLAAIATSAWLLSSRKFCSELFPSFFPSPDLFTKCINKDGLLEEEGERFGRDGSSIEGGTEKKFYFGWEDSESIFMR